MLNSKKFKVECRYFISLIKKRISIDSTKIKEVLGIQVSRLLHKTSTNIVEPKYFSVYH